MTALGHDVAAQLAARTKEVARLRKNMWASPRVAEIFYSAGFHDAGGTGQPRVIASVHWLGIENGRRSIGLPPPSSPPPARPRKRRHLKVVQS